MKDVELLPFVGPVRRQLGGALRARVAGPDAAKAAERIWLTPGPRWFTEDDPIWRVHADAAMFTGGISALLLQSLHPQAMAGVVGHSGYRSDPWGRLQRTSHYLATTTYGTIDDATATIEHVRSIHERVRGKDDVGAPYRASDPHLLRWVHVAEVWSFLHAFERYGAGTLTPEEADRYVAQTAVPAHRLGARDLPETVAELDGRPRGLPPRTARHAGRPRLGPLPAAQPAPADRAARWLLADGDGRRPPAAELGPPRTAPARRRPGPHHRIGRRPAQHRHRPLGHDPDPARRTGRHRTVLTCVGGLGHDGRVSTQTEHADTLRRLHTDPDILVLINVWDVASAHAVAGRPQTRALATASAAVAAAHGYEDGEHIPLPLVVDTVRRIAAATDLPVTVDLEAGYGDVAASVAQILDAGAVGANVEDGMEPIDVMRTRITDTIAAGERAGVPLVLNARTDVYLSRGEWSEDERLAEATTRGQAFLDAGADCVFVPAVSEEASIRALAEAFSGRLSVMWVPNLAAPATLQEWGVARISHGPFAQMAAMAALGEYADAHAH